MLATQLLEIEKCTQSKIDAVDFNNIPFGRTFSDHMLVAEYFDGQWQTAKIMPYGPIPLSPATSALHYGQAIFEGMKAHRTTDGRIAMFRPDKNIARFNKSAVRMSMPEVPEDIFMEGLLELIKLDIAWIPNKEGCSLYMRPLMFANEPCIGVKTSDRYMFIIMVGPVGPYYSEPVSVLVSEEYARAVKGGVGYAKTAGNYGRTLYPVELARKQGYKDILWLDGREQKYVEEIGTMNVFFVLDGKLITPSIDGTFLEGVTRESVIRIAQDLGYEVEQRKIDIAEIVAAHNNGLLEEMFGTGTAATVTHINRFGFRGEDYHLDLDKAVISKRIKEELEGIKSNAVPDRHGWLKFVE
ncbi:MAG: branched-chain amino acid aminotransferase [Bacteroidetes bacterium]|nr:branched-chain amino acid aminotransferase [Bacteroidota bacterium]